MDKQAIQTKAAFDFVRYANVWEDAGILCRALAPTTQGKRILSIASSGDNALALLTLDPSEVIAVDMNPAQINACLLRVQAMRQLEHKQVLEFLGVLPCTERLETYEKLELNDTCRSFWSAHLDAIETGVIFSGKFERYLLLFGQKILPWIHSTWKREELLAKKTLEEQEMFYQKYWDTLLWRGLFKVFFSRFVMGRLGRDPAFFEHVEGSVGERILGRTWHALTQISTHENPYLQFIIGGNFQKDALPLYLRPEHFNTIRGRLDRVQFKLGRVQDQEGPFHGMNLSDIFEYMDEEEFESVYRQLAALLASGGRMAYWNMLAPRRCPSSLLGKFRPLQDLAKALHLEDQAWFYGAFHLDEKVVDDR